MVKSQGIMSSIIKDMIVGVGLKDDKNGVLVGCWTFENSVDFSENFRLMLSLGKLAFESHFF